ncbi:superoxide dismutase family protein [Oceanobacillus massiliensis]|uniref:superoxide dismutase family protein n=1 Tax=Oceanobacillus massiliensis TaxID=1465765 RepID=UPI00028A155E|nr:superoxide dismutase family protein [Oceanobacillus massiliensis]
MNRAMIMIFLLSLAMFLTACGGNEAEQDTQNQNTDDSTQSESANEEAQETNATAEEEVLVSLKNPEGQVVGTATLTEEESGVGIKLEGEDLPPGSHGFHIHEVGKCDPPDFESAGAHYNPTDAKHGFDDPEGPHAGDMKNIEVAEDGTVTADVLNEMVTLKEGTDNTLYTEEGTALMIHSDADDYKTQPSGNAGERIACGVIGE